MHFYNDGDTYILPKFEKKSLCKMIIISVVIS